MIQVSGGYYHSAALTVNRHVYTWGWGEHGQLGHGVPKDELVPRCVEKLIELTENRDEVVREVHCGGLHTLAVTGTFIGSQTLPLLCLFDPTLVECLDEFVLLNNNDGGCDGMCV